MTAMKVVHLITGLNVGGAEMMLYKLVSRTDRERFHNTVVSMIDVGPIGQRIRELGVEVRSLGMRRGWPNPSALVALARLLSRERPALLQTWMYHANLLGSAAGLVAGTPQVVWNVRCSDAVLNQASRRTIWTIKASARVSHWPSAVVVNSRAGQQLHVSLGYRPRSWHVIPNGFELGRFSPDGTARDAVRDELGMERDGLLIGLIGRDDPMKGLDTFLQGAMELNACYPEAHFLLAGRGVVPTNDALTAVIKGHPVERSVHLLGERDDVPRLLAALDVAVSSSRTEGFSNVIGEAMACGVPMVVTDVGDSALVVGDTGLVVPPRNPQALAKGCIELIEAGPEARRARGRAARERVREQFSLDRVVGAYEDLYASVGRS